MPIVAEAATLEPQAAPMNAQAQIVARASPAGILENHFRPISKAVRNAGIEGEMAHKNEERDDDVEVFGVGGIGNLPQHAEGRRKSGQQADAD